MVLESWLEIFIGGVPEKYRLIVILIVYTIFIAVYAVFIWRFYKFVASRDILKLNLSRYNNAVHPKLEKILAVSLYTLEYIIILPFLVLFWFTVFSLFLMVFSRTQEVEIILLISAAIITSIRITSYISSDLSRDVAKILPFTILGMLILGDNFFNLNTLIDRILQIPSLFNHIIIFIVFIFAVEFLLRVLYSLSLLFQTDSPKEE